MRARRAEFVRLRDVQRRKQAEADDKRMAAKSAEIRGLSESELAIRRAENKQKAYRSRGPLRVDPIGPGRPGGSPVRSHP